MTAFRNLCADDDWLLVAGTGASARPRQEAVVASEASRGAFTAEARGVRRSLRH